jgi:3-deoxy-manno-octulosonate cytidylyltransferase (CMP-KDO synthetase)
MIEFENTALVVTARMAGGALPGRPMLDVNGKPLIFVALANAEAAKLGHVMVAAAENRIAEAVREAGGDAMAAPGHLLAEADQVAAVLKMRDPQRRFQHVLILPASYATIEALALRRCLAGLLNKDVDAATLAAPLAEGEAAPVLVSAPLDGDRELAYIRDFSFPGKGPGFEHIPIYAWRRAALERFATLPPDGRERQGGPEALRALFHGQRMVGVKVDTAPFSVDTPDDLEALRRLLKD